MDVKINELTASENEIEVTFTYDEVKKDIEKEVLKQTKKIQMPGFRKGKVPISMLKKMYGDSFEHEASEKVANDKFWDISKEKHLHPLGQPTLTDIKFNPGTDLYFKVKYEVMPKLEVDNYTGLEIEIPNLEVKDDDVQREIDYILKSNATNEEAEEVGDDNNYILDVEIQRVDEKNEPIADTKPENLQLDLSNERIQPEIIENSKGKKVGESFNFSFTDERIIKNEEGEEEQVKDEYNYSAKIIKIQKIVLPDVNEEFVKKVSKDKVSTEEELRADIRKDIKAYLDQRTDDLVRDKFINLIVKNNDFVPPTTLVNNILADFVKREEEEAKKQHQRRFDKNEASNRLMPMAELEVKWFLIKDAIQKKEELSLNEDELKELAEKDAEKTGIAVDKLLNYYKASNYGEKLVDNKLFDFLKEKNTINKVDPEKHTPNETKEDK